MTISVVIPTLDEAECVVEAVESAFGGGSRCPSSAASPRDRGEREGQSGRVEVVVVDGGSRDATRQRAEEAGARVFLVPGDQSAGPGGASIGAAAPTKVESGGARRGRAYQLQLGVEKTKGEVLLFLHADTRLPTGWQAAVEGILADPLVSGGAFGLRFAERGGWERWIEFWVAVRVAFLRLPYGDQALFVRRDVIDRMGGMPQVAMMEDLDLVRVIRRSGRLAVLPMRVVTSSRRYRSRGPLRTILWHQLALLGWYLGWDRARLAKRMGR